MMKMGETFRGDMGREQKKTDDSEILSQKMVKAKPEAYQKESKKTLNDSAGGPNPTVYTLIYLHGG